MLKNKKTSGLVFAVVVIVLILLIVFSLNTSESELNHLIEIRLKQQIGVFDQHLAVLVESFKKGLANCQEDTSSLRIQYNVLKTEFDKWKAEFDQWKEVTPLVENNTDLNLDQ